MSDREKSKKFKLRNSVLRFHPENVKTHFVQHTPARWAFEGQRGHFYFRPIIISVIRLNSAPCNGFVIGLAHMSFVGQYCTSTFPFSH